MTDQLTLVSFDLCPYVQRAAIVLAEKGVAFTRLDVDLADKPEWFKAISPLGKVPLLKIGDDTVLFESGPIVEYLDEVHGAPLHPRDPLARARHRGWMELASAALADIWTLETTPEPEAIPCRRNFPAPEAQPHRRGAERRTVLRRPAVPAGRRGVGAGVPLLRRLRDAGRPCTGGGMRETYCMAPRTGAPALRAARRGGRLPRQARSVSVPPAIAPFATDHAE